ncbi:hypothetical protein VTJ49DRAFT_813 [Mycothermus thermophilus]|uniref:Jacalin-type lectin domain-containing protein n=1 Tax=Humicola insolens TaxID=85995 RepID=A0ABR3VFL5_HUMIN
MMARSGTTVNQGEPITTPEDFVNGEGADAGEALDATTTPSRINRRPMTTKKVTLLAVAWLTILSALRNKRVPLPVRRFIYYPIVLNVVSLGFVDLVEYLLRYISRTGWNWRKFRPALFFWWCSLASLAAAEPWNQALCVQPTVVGTRSDGDPFTILGDAGSSVRMLRVYRSNGRTGYLRGLDVRFSDGVERSQGSRKDQFSELTLDDDEVIQSMTLWATPPGRFFSFFSRGGRVARLDITTNRRSWGYGIDNAAKLAAQAVNVGSGVLVGFRGRSGDDLDQLAPLFLKKLSQSTVHNITYNRPVGAEGLRLLILREGTALWNGTDYSWTFSGTEAWGTETTFNIGSAFIFLVGTRFAVQLPQIGISGFDVQWTYTSTANYEKKNI